MTVRNLDVDSSREELPVIPGFQVDVILDGRVLVVSVDGCVPAETFSQANEAGLFLMGGQCRYVILELSRMTKASSKCMGLIAYYASVMKKKGGEVLLVPPAPDVMQRIGAEALSGMIRFAPSLEEALECVRGVMGVSEAVCKPN